MPVGLDSFRNIASDFATQDSQRIFTQNNSLQEKSAFGFFKFSSRKSENDATVASFLNAIKADPTYKTYLSNATGLLQANVPAGKPLTAKVVRQVMDGMDKQIQLCRIANQNAQASLEGTSFSKPFMGKFTQYCIQNHVSLNPENREAIKLNLINFMKASQTNAMLSNICSRNGISEGSISGFANMLQKMNIVETTIDQIFSENPDGIPQNIDAKLEQALEQTLEPALVLKALIPEKSLAEFCSRFTVDNAMNVVKTTLTMYEQGIINADETFMAFNHLQMSGIDHANPMDTDEAKNLAITDFVLNKRMESTIAQQLEAKGLPASLAKPLSHYPDFYSAMQTKLADANIDFMGGAYIEADLTAMISETFDNFMSDKANMLNAFIPLATTMHIAEEDMPKCINAFIGCEAFAKALAPSPTGVGDKEAFIAALREATQAMASSAHGFAGEFGKDDSLKVMRTVLAMHFAYAGTPITIAHVQYMQSEFSQLSTEFASSSSFVHKDTPQSTKDAIQAETIQLHELLSQANKAILSSYLQGQGVSNAESDTHIIVDGKNIHELANEFTKPVVHLGTHIKSSAFIRYAEEVGIPLFDNELVNAVSEKYFKTGSEMVHAAPPARFIRLFEGIKDRLGLDSASLGEVKVDVNAINSNNFYVEARNSVLAYTKAHPDIALTEDDIALLYEKSISEQLANVAEAVHHIRTTPLFTDDQKQRYIDMVLSTKITDAGVLDDLVQEMNPMQRINLHTAAELLQNTQDFSAALPDVFIAMTNSLTRIMQNNQEAIARMGDPGELRRAVSMFLLKGANLNPAQRNALADTMHGQTIVNFAKAIMTCRMSSHLDSYQVLQIKISALHGLLGAFQTEADDYSGRVGEHSTVPFPDDLSSRSAELEQSHIQALIRFVGPKIYEEFTDVDITLAGLQDRVSDEDWATLRGQFITLTRGASLEDHDKRLLASMIVAKRDALLDASLASDAPLTAAQITGILCTDAAAGIESPVSVDIFEDMPQHVLARQAASIGIRQAREALSNSGAMDGTQAARKARPAIMELGMTPAKIIKFAQTGTLRLEDIPSGLQLPSLNKYSAKTGFGLYSDFPQMGATAALTMQSKDGQGMLVTPQAHPDGAENNPHIQKMIDFAASITQNETQQARVLQAFSQASKAHLQMCTSLLGMNPVITEHDAFDITAIQQDDNSVVMQIRSKDDSPYNVVMDYHIPPDGSAQCTDFLLQMKN